jgi:hypothetical protein
MIGLKESALTITIIGYVERGVWNNQDSIPGLLDSFIEGQYGFEPRSLHVNANDKGQPPRGALANVLRRIIAGSVGEIEFRSAGMDEAPLATVSLADEPHQECHVALELPYTPGREYEVLHLAETLAGESHARFLLAHDTDDWMRLHHERPLLVLPRSCLRGAFWVTFLCSDYVKRLGGKERVLAAPFFQSRLVEGGVMLISHPDPLDMDREPRRAEIQRLQEYLKALVAGGSR